MERRTAMAEHAHAAPVMLERQRRRRVARSWERVRHWNIFRWAGEALDTVLRRPASTEGL
jgi:trehalose-6-phosphate synthase